MTDKEVKRFIDKFCITKDFPKEGINFIDIFPLINRVTLGRIANDLRTNATAVIVPEARGFIFSACFDKPIVPIRKSGKLPGKVFKISSTKEYGQDVLEIQRSHLEALTDGWLTKEVPIPVSIMDDVLATGGTAQSIIDFINTVDIDGYTFKVVDALFFIEIKALNGRDKLKNVKVKVVYEY